MPIPHLPVEIIRLVLENVVVSLSAARYHDRFAVMELATVCKSWPSIVVDAVLSKVQVSTENIEWLVPALVNRPSLLDRVRALILDHETEVTAMPPELRGRLLRRIMFPVEDDPLVGLLENSRQLTAVELMVLQPNLNLLKALEKAGVQSRLRIARLCLDRTATELPPAARVALLAFLAQCRTLRKLIVLDIGGCLAASDSAGVVTDDLPPVEVVKLVCSHASDPAKSIQNLCTCIDPAAIRKLEVVLSSLTGV